MVGVLVVYITDTQGHTTYILLAKGSYTNSFSLAVCRWYEVCMYTTKQSYQPDKQAVVMLKYVEVGVCQMVHKHLRREL